jgi:hypothetical protein
MAKDRVETGSATGWQVEEDAGGGFEWTAFGPLGSRRGRADTRAEAEAAARRSEQELSELPRTH